MARTKKTETTDDKSDAKTEPAQVKTEIAQVKKTEKKTEKKTDTKIVKEVKAPKNDIVTAVPDEPVVVDIACSDTALSSEFTQILSQVQTLTQQFSTLRTSLRALEKKTIRDLKIATKAGKKNKRAKSNRQPSGFVKPTLISIELATFLGKPKGTEMARTEVTKEINTYIRANSLQDPKNGRRIIPDTKLTALLNLKDIDELTYFNLQKFMSPHFAKASDTKPAVLKV